MNQIARDRALALAHINIAVENLYAAARATCDLPGWREQWQAIGDKADEVKALWHTINDAPLPIGHDEEKGGEP